MYVFIPVVLAEAFVEGEQLRCGRALDAGPGHVEEAAQVALVVVLRLLLAARLALEGLRTHQLLLRLPRILP